MYYSLWFPFVSNLHLTLLVRGHASSLCSLLTDKMRWSDTCSTCPKANFPLLHHLRLVWWPTTVTAKPKTSRQKQKHHGKTKNLTAKTKYLTAKPNTSQQKQNSFGFAVGICFCREVFGFCCEVFGFAVRSLVLPWGFWFCRELFCFCREVFGFAVKVVGHRTVCTWKPIIGGNIRSLFPLQFYKDDLKQFGVQALLFNPVSDYSFHGSERFCKLTPMKNWPSSRKAGLSRVFEDVLPHRLPVKFGGSLLY